jgi:hypothetical protein
MCQFMKTLRINLEQIGSLVVRASRLLSYEDIMLTNLSGNISYRGDGDTVHAVGPGVSRQQLET